MWGRWGGTSCRAESSSEGWGRRAHYSGTTHHAEDQVAPALAHNDVQTGRAACSFLRVRRTPKATHPFRNPLARRKSFAPKRQIRLLIHSSYLAHLMRIPGGAYRTGEVIMRYWFGFMLALALSVVGCSETTGTGGNGGTAGNGGTGGTDQCAGAVNGTQCSGGACLDGVCSALTTVSGTVTLFESPSDEGSPAPGVTVSWFGTSFSATTAASGAFSLEVPVGLVFLQHEKEGLWGGIGLYSVPTAGLADLEFYVGTDDFMAQLVEDLMIDIDETKGVVNVGFRTPGFGGESATLGVPHDHVVANDADGKLVESDELISGGGRDLTFLGVDLTDELTVTPSGVEGVSTCSLEYPGTVYPVQARSWTDVQAGCEPIP